MHWKQKGYYFGVLLIYTFTTITLPPVGWCKPTVYSSQPNSDPAHHNDLTTPAHHFIQEDKRQEQLDSGNQGEESSPSGVFDTFMNGYQRLRHGMASSASDSNFNNRNKPKQPEAEWIYSSVSSSNEDCEAGNINHVTKGKFYISGRLETNVGYQSDSAFPGKSEAFSRCFKKHYYSEIANGCFFISKC